MKDVRGLNTEIQRPFLVTVWRWKSNLEGPIRNPYWGDLDCSEPLQHETGDVDDSSKNPPLGKEDESLGEDIDEDFVLQDESCTIVTISEKERRQLNTLFPRPLIIKLLGRGIGFKFLEQKLQ